jgi:hypothetical protein
MRERVKLVFHVYNTLIEFMPNVNRFFVFRGNAKLRAADDANSMLSFVIQKFQTHRAARVNYKNLHLALGFRLVSLENENSTRARGKGIWNAKKCRATQFTFRMARSFHGRICCNNIVSIASKNESCAAVMTFRESFFLLSRVRLVSFPSSFFNCQ